MNIDENLSREQIKAIQDEVKRQATHLKKLLKKEYNKEYSKRRYHEDEEFKATIKEKARARYHMNKPSNV